jgi:hypothetical protein
MPGAARASRIGGQDAADAADGLVSRRCAGCNTANLLPGNPEFLARRPSAPAIFRP